MSKDWSYIGACWERRNRRRNRWSRPPVLFADQLKNRQVVIYALYAAGEVFYVGKTVDLATRFQTHLSASRQMALGANHRRIRELLAHGTIPEVRLVQVVPEVWWEQAERFWIAEFRRRGCPLLNSTDGGYGPRWLEDDDPVALSMRNH